MLGISTQLETDGKKIVPARSHGIPVVSMGFLTKDETPIIWRGPMLHKALTQFLKDLGVNGCHCFLQGLLKVGR